MKKLVLIAIIILSAFLLVSCGQKEAPEEPAPEPVAEAVAPEPVSVPGSVDEQLTELEVREQFTGEIMAGVKTIEELRDELGTVVKIDQGAFSPRRLTVPVGTTVYWVNYEITDRTVTADDGSFDSGLLPLRGMYSHTFDSAGTFAYSSVNTRTLKGTVTVE